MGVLSLHNECPPISYSSGDAVKAAAGLVVGEAATSANLRAISDCIQSLAYLDDTVASVVSAWSDLMAGAESVGVLDVEQKVKDVHANFDQSFEAIARTTERVALAVQKYRELQGYARDALSEGRGRNFEKAYLERGEKGFGHMIDRRIELLRKLQVRIEVLKQLHGYGRQLLRSNNFPDFFLLLMQPIRDVSVAVNELYSEMVRGALVSYTVMLQTCQLPDEGAWAVATSQLAEPVAVAEPSVGLGGASIARGALQMPTWPNRPGGKRS